MKAQTTLNAIGNGASAPVSAGPSGGAGRRRGKAITLVDVQDQQDRAGDEVMNAEYPKRLLVPTY
ncbi:MAG TPA: hypothetical protein VNC13_13035 [Propionibacteriaceae bacterium]|nr:hypothetical protein [Propionibacteriaceae bacterium]